MSSISKDNFCLAGMNLCSLDTHYLVTFQRSFAFSIGVVDNQCARDHSVYFQESFEAAFLLEMAVAETQIFSTNSLIDPTISSAEMKKFARWLRKMQAQLPGTIYSKANNVIWVIESI